MDSVDKKKSYIFSILGLAVLIAIDQISKYLAVTHLKDSDGIKLINGVFELLYVENKGAAFGVMQGQQIILLIVTCIVLIAAIYIFTRIPADKKYRIMKILAVFIIAGAIGNMIDRVIYQYVVDFFYFSLIDFPVFNVADCYITVSVIILFILIVFYYKEDELNFLFKKIDTDKETTK